MTIQPARLFGDPILRARAAEVETFDQQVRQLVTDLTDTMYESGGVGTSQSRIILPRSYSCPPQTPDCPVRAAKSPHSRRMGQAAQMVRA